MIYIILWCVLQDKVVQYHICSWTVYRKSLGSLTFQRNEVPLNKCYHTQHHLVDKHKYIKCFHTSVQILTWIWILTPSKKWYEIESHEAIILSSERSKILQRNQKQLNNYCHPQHHIGDKNWILHLYFAYHVGTL